MKELACVVCVCVLSVFGVAAIRTGINGISIEPVHRQCSKCQEMNSAESDSLYWTCTRCGSYHLISSGVTASSSDDDPTQ